MSESEPAGFVGGGADHLDESVSSRPVYRVRDGKAIWSATYFQRADALREINLTEEDLSPAE